MSLKTYFLQVKEVVEETSDSVTIYFWHPLSEQIKYKAGQFITISGKDCDGLYIIKDGKAKSKDDQHFFMSSSFGFPSDSDLSVPSVEITAETDCEILWLPKVILQLLNMRPTMPYEFSIFVNKEDLINKEYNVYQRFINKI